VLTFRGALHKIYCGIDGWATLIAVMDAGSREIVGYRFSRRGRAIEAIDAFNINTSGPKRSI